MGTNTVHRLEILFMTNAVFCYANQKIAMSKTKHPGSIDRVDFFRMFCGYWQRVAWSRVVATQRQREGLRSPKPHPDFPLTTMLLYTSTMYVKHRRRPENADKFQIYHPHLAVNPTSFLVLSLNRFQACCMVRLTWGSLNIRLFVHVHIHNSTFFVYSLGLYNAYGPFVLTFFWLIDDGTFVYLSI